jgi:hypothetical protein
LTVGDKVLQRTRGQELNRDKRSIEAAGVRGRPARGVAMLFSYASVWNTCLLILRERGYRLFLHGDPNQRSYFYGGLNQKLVGVEHVRPIRQII